ncbi:MAG TPA: FMN-binding negative transcriptional regulator [Actinomycetales bacterium]|nr:FMN-binding negative transcriptional regulator [Actinomycetales bacterium]
MARRERPVGREAEQQERPVGPRGMYVPVSYQFPGERYREFVAEHVGAHFVTHTEAGGLESTLLPIVWEKDRVLIHMAADNPQSRHIADGEKALLIVQGPQAYISPRWEAVRELTRPMVPTWNYLQVQLRGTITVRNDEAFLLRAMGKLTNQEENKREDPWRVHELPISNLHAAMPRIVGVEVTVTSAEGKAKLSQNHSAENRRGQIAGLRARGGAQDLAVADAMEEFLAAAPTMAQLAARENPGELPGD